MDFLDCHLSFGNLQGFESTIARIPVDKIPIATLTAQDDQW